MSPVRAAVRAAVRSAVLPVGRVHPFRQGYLVRARLLSVLVLTTMLLGAVEVEAAGLGRLFFTPQERKEIDEVRKNYDPTRQEIIVKEAPRPGAAPHRRRYRNYRCRGLCFGQAGEMPPGSMALDCSTAKPLRMAFGLRPRRTVVQSDSSCRAVPTPAR